jgi:hypothetical protein
LARQVHAVRAKRQCHIESVVDRQPRAAASQPLVAPRSQCVAVPLSGRVAVPLSWRVADPWSAVADDRPKPLAEPMHRQRRGLLVAQLHPVDATEHGLLDGTQQLVGRRARLAHEMQLKTPRHRGERFPPLV